LVIISKSTTRVERQCGAYSFSGYYGKLPENWVSTTVSQLGFVQTGNTPSKTKPKYYD
jgi:hypothetical protein